MSVLNIADLREPPVVGRYYLVPCIRWKWHGMVADWPVNGPLHHDREGIGFDPVHYHIDGRFLTAKQARLAFRRESWMVAPPINANPLCNLYGAGPYTSGMPVRPTLQRRRCSRASYAFEVPEHRTEAWGLKDRYGSPATAICRKDGRKLCPHRKVDLSQFLPDADGIVTCPLHGLRVKVALSDPLSDLPF